MRSIYYILHLPVLVAVLICMVFFFNFTAEDAFITYRYAENWINTGSLVYNSGEPINAMTSPAHAILSAVLFWVTGNTVLSNKILAVVLVSISALIVWSQFKQQPQWQLMALALILLPPSVILWTFGGLETALLLFLVTLTVYLAIRTPPFNFKVVCVVGLLAGLGLLTRYDSILFFFPLLTYVALHASSKKFAAVAFCGAALMLATWLAISFSYYGDLLPTSFYVKTPSLSSSGFLFNGLYISAYLLFVGLIPALLLIIFLAKPNHGLLALVYQHIKDRLWLYAGLLLVLLYGLSIATHHMMFSFRFFVPYIPAAVMLVVELLRFVSEQQGIDILSGRSAGIITGFLVCLVLFQVYQSVYTFRRSVNGLAPIGEYRSLGLQDYGRFILVLKQEAHDIEQHWEMAGESLARQPRIITFAAGMLPYTFRDAYIYEKLVSYRHCQQRQNQGFHADYLHILAPRLGTIDEQLPGPDERYSLVSAYELEFDGSIQMFLVYHNPQPEANNLGARIYEHCQPLEEAKAPISISTER